MISNSYDIVPPSASAMIESMRAYGYSLPMAIADLIDNSISAESNIVWINFHWAGPESWISVADNGHGMSEKHLVSAMKLGSQNPLEEREQSDLGRFGLGMKTASFSQCRRLTVLSVKDDIESIRCWDLDFIADSAKKGKDEWLLLKNVAKESENKFGYPLRSKKGTVVLWEILDRIVSDSPVSDDSAHRTFLQRIEETSNYLAMVFHRFIEGNQPNLKIYINGINPHNRIKAWNPFLESHPCTEKTPKESIRVQGHSIIVKGYVLPHKDRFEPDEHKKAGGPKGWNAQQGYYVYRNQRLMVAGSWLGLGQNQPWTQEEHYKLARISVDIPNSLDHLWQIDVKKSSAVPPLCIKNRLTELANEVRQRARSVYAHRGKHGPRPPKRYIIHPWIAETKEGKPFYRIDRKHPLVIEAITIAGKRKHVIDALLQVIEQTVPVQRIWLDAAEKPDSNLQPFENRTNNEVREIIKCTYEALLTNGKSPKEAIEHLLVFEEFSDYHELIDNIGEQ